MTRMRPEPVEGRASTGSARIVSRRRPLVGPLMAVIGVIHVAITPVVHGASVRSVVDGGVVATIDAEPALAERRGVGFWYATAGLAMIAYGVAIAERERQDAPLPASLPLSMAAIGTWGVALMPKSPFWVFGPLAGLAAIRRSTARR
jgi:Family of unknown function (DUF6463)